MTPADCRVLIGADLTTVMREIPFSAIQFPLYEGAKKAWGDWQGRPVNTLQASLCGSVCGGFAAAVTTPLDVTKTRLMLGADAKGVPYKVKGCVLTLREADARSCDLVVGLTSHTMQSCASGNDLDDQPSGFRGRSWDPLLWNCASGVLDLDWRRSLFGRLRAGQVDLDRHRLSRLV